MTDERAQARECAAWSRAMDSAASQFEGYVRRDELKTPEQRRRALDDAFQHAYGILALAATQEQPTPGRENLETILVWCQKERAKLGGVDGFDYRSGEEFGIRRVEIQVEKALAATQDTDVLTTMGSA